MLVALADNSLRCYDTGAFDLMAFLYSLFFFLFVSLRRLLKDHVTGENEYHCSPPL